MSKRSLYILVGFFMLALLVMPAWQFAQALDLGGNYINIGVPQKDPRVLAIDIIKIALEFLGLIALVLVLLAGFKWMTAAGNEEKVEEAKKLLWAGIIGLVIIVSAFAVANFVLSSLVNVVTR